MPSLTATYVPDEQTSDPDLTPVTITRLPSNTVEVYRCPISGNLMISGLDGIAELSPADQAALLMLLMLDGAQ